MTTTAALRVIATTAAQLFLRGMAGEDEEWCVRNPDRIVYVYELNGRLWFVQYGKPATYADMDEILKEDPELVDDYPRWDEVFD